MRIWTFFGGNKEVLSYFLQFKTFKTQQLGFMIICTFKRFNERLTVKWDKNISILLNRIELIEAITKFLFEKNVLEKT